MNAIEERREQVARMTRNGLSARQIAEELGVTPRTVVRDRRAAGVLQPAPRPLTAAQLEQAGQLLAGGCSYAETARTVGATPEGIRRHFPGKGWSSTEAATWALYIYRITQRKAAA